MTASKICMKCNTPKPMNKFAINDYLKEKYDLWCKDCRTKHVNNEQSLKIYLFENKRPYNEDLLKCCIEESEQKNKTKNINDYNIIVKNAIRIYFQKIPLLNSCDGGKKLNKNDLKETNTKINTKTKNNNQNKKKKVEPPSEELIEKWGEGYDSYEYQLFEKKWNNLIDNYGEKTALHIENLKIYIRYRTKEEISTASKDVKGAKEWGALASKAAEDAKINVRQLSKSDISGGIDLVPQIFEAVESNLGIISILPKLKEQPYDDVDLIIWTIINYLRRLENKPRIKYRDIWDFYDQMLEESFIQKGYSEEMVLIEKEKRNNIFRDLDLVYIEPLYKDGEL